MNCRNDLNVSIREASYLIAFGSAVLCVGSPLMSWLTSNLDRRLALAGAMLVIALAHIASAFVTTFGSLLAIRMVMLLAAAFFTPQAASLAGVVAAPEKRASTVAYVFIGWSLALALGVPLVTAIASRYGWPASYLAIGAIGLACFVFLCFAVPARFITPPVDLKTWVELFRSPIILTLLAISCDLRLRAVHGADLHRAAAGAARQDQCGRHQPCDRALRRRRHRRQHRRRAHRRSDRSVHDLADLRGLGCDRHGGVVGRRLALFSRCCAGVADLGLRLLGHQFAAAGEAGAGGARR